MLGSSETYFLKERVYELRQTLLEKLEELNLPVSEHDKFFNNLAVLDFESICVPTEELKETQTTTWIGNHIPISVSISSNMMIDELIFLYNKDPRNLIIDFVTNFELLAEQNKLKMRISRPIERSPKKFSYNNDPQNLIIDVLLTCWLSKIS